jgi:hypothetical protein
MPKFAVRRPALVVALVAVAAALVAAPAAQADSPAGQHLVAFSKVPNETRCVKVERWGSAVRLQNLPSGRSFKSNVHVSNDSTPELTFYSSSNCTSGEQSYGFIDVNRDNLAYVWVSWRNYHPYWGHPGLAG